MANKQKTLHLLILDKSQNDAESLVSLLRNAGRATRAHRITSEDDLEEQLKEHNWDLLLARDEDANYKAQDVLATLKRLDKDIPAIVLGKEYTEDRAAGFLKLGASDFIPFENTKHLLFAIKREQANLEQRRSKKSLSTHLREAEKRCKLLLDSSKDAIAYTNDGMHIYANPSYMEFLGYDDMDELMCIPVLDTLGDKAQNEFKEKTKSFNEDDPTQATIEISTISKRSDDTEIEISMSLSSATWEEEPCTQIVIRPKQDNAELAEKLKQISSQDLLTGLYNRQFFMEELSSAIDECVKTKQNGALLYISLDDFVKQKSEIGLAGADLILSDIANILRRHASESDIVARLSDDTFGLILQGIDDKTALSKSESLRKAIEDHLSEVSGKTVQVTCSIGIALITENAPNGQDLLGRAHVACDDVKTLEGHEKGNGCLMYAPKNVKKDGEEANTPITLQKALDENRFKLLFQPIINLRGDEREHYEAFLRMMNEDNEEVSPYDFLPPAGPSETASKIDRWVILQTIKHLSAHRSKGHNTRLFLNLTAETLQDKTFLPWLSVALKAARLPGDSLIFQINESDATTYLKQAKDFSKGLKELHCKTSISRFGCALNPFNTLKHFEADYIKFDGSYTEEIQKDGDTREQLKEMVSTLHAQGKLTVVPFVENASVLSMLWQAGVNYIQGYYLQAPSAEMNYNFEEEG
jgi:diguanylate cyclase (GGDEF)-like protein